MAVSIWLMWNELKLSDVMKIQKEFSGQVEEKINWKAWKTNENVVIIFCLLLIFKWKYKN